MGNRVVVVYLFRDNVYSVIYHLKNSVVMFDVLSVHLLA
jgi:hypothetical protein